MRVVCIKATILWAVHFYRHSLFQNCPPSFKGNQMKRLIMWILIKREFNRINDTGLFRICKAKSGSYYIQKIRYTKRKRWIAKDIVRVSDHYTTNNTGHSYPPSKNIKHSMKQIIVKNMFNIEYYD